VGVTRAGPPVRPVVLARREEGFMSVALSDQQRQLLAELEGLPDEYFPLLVQLIRAYRESVLLKPAAV